MSANVQVINPVVDAKGEGNSSNPQEQVTVPLVVAPKEMLPRWAIITIVAALCGVATAGTVYYLKQKRKEQLKASRYGGLPYESGLTNSKLNKYWALTVNVFSNVRTMITSIVSKETTKMDSPLIDATKLGHSPAMNAYADADL